MPRALGSVIADIQSIWRYSCARTVPEIENEYKSAFAQLIESEALNQHGSYSIAPTASNSIDTIATYIASLKLKTALIEPCFDNLYLILKRRNVSLSAITEDELENIDLLKKRIIAESIGCLFIVSPNNPTGWELEKGSFIDLCKLCREVGVLLVIDRTFRFYATRPYDDYQILLESGVSFACVEDTGKTWPTQDMKVSMLSYSEDISVSVRRIYEEIFLCSSNFSLALLTRLVRQTYEVGLDQVVREEVRIRRQMLMTALEATPLVLANHRENSQLPFAWLDISFTNYSDLQLVELLAEDGVAVLPGRYFYWSSAARHGNRIRVSLMRPNNVLFGGLAGLRRSFSELFANNTQGENQLSV
jgi:aspartate/methionine/tyrosine aminotransferase